MIDKKEIMRFVGKFGILANHIEKDYVLNWLLAGIASHPETRSNWVFKGGTCLRKCFLETYRFSEDLDFTLRDDSQMNEMFLKRILTEITEEISEKAGIEFPLDLIGISVYTNKVNRLMAQGGIAYRGPMRQRRGSLPRIKLDLTADEALVQEPVVRPVHHSYTDCPPEGIFVRSYSYEEIFAEKVRALAERGLPRDVYDVVHLYRYEKDRSDGARVMNVLREKCAFKGIDVPVADDFEDQKKQGRVRSAWGNMLDSQLPALPPCEPFWAELPPALDWLHGLSGKRRLPPAPVAGEDLDEDWRPPPMIHVWEVKAPLERVRFAAANRLCVNLTLAGSKALTEPYSLRRTREGDLLVFAVDRSTGQMHPYEADRIKGIEVSDEPFTPRYAIDLTPHRVE